MAQIWRRNGAVDLVLFRECASKTVRARRRDFPAAVDPFVSTRRLPAVSLATAILVPVFGWLTLYLQDATFIKMKPTVLHAGFGAALIGGLATNKPVPAHHI
jgi:Intracellular septation protein A